MIRWLFIVIAFSCSAFAATFYVAPGASGDGTAGNPGSFIVAAGRTNWASAITGGDTVILNNGTYNYGTNILFLTWNGGSFVTWQAAPGAQPKINIPIRFGSGNNHRFVNLEFYDSNKEMREEAIGYFDSDTGTNFQWIGCTIHDLPGVWTGKSGGGSIRWCVIWYVGQHLRDHITYPQVYEFVGNIVYWTSGNDIELGFGGMILTSNIFVGTGITVNSAGATLNITQGTNALIKHNLIYNYINLDQKGVLLQNSSGTVLADNTVSAPAPLVLNGATGHEYTVTNNDFFASRPVASFVVRRSATDGTYVWDENGYWDVDSAVTFSDASVSQTFAQWKAANPTFDGNSTATNAANPPDSVRVFHNYDDKFHTHVGIFNWSGAHNVTVNLAGVIQAGNIYYVRSAQDYNGALVQSGAFNGTSISLPMTNLNVAPVLYGTNVLPTASSPNFAAFVIVAVGTKASGMTFSGGVLR